MKKLSVVTILCLIFLCACQPTPDEEIVMNRTDGKLEQAIVATAAPAYIFEAPSHWEETFMARNREVRISADVEVPTAEQFPVTTIKQHKFTTSDVVYFLQGVCSGNWVIRENEYSREELTEDLKHAAKGTYMGIDETTGEQIWQPNEEEMKRIQSLIEQAPLEDSFQPLTAENLSFPIKTIPVKDSSGLTWYLFGKNNTNSLVTLRQHRDGVIQTENVVLQGEATPGEMPHTLDHILISQDEAIVKGDACILSLGLNGFRVAEVQKARETQSYTYAVYGEGYWLTYVNTLEGTVPCFYGDYGNPDFLSFTQDDGMTYAPKWRQECVQIFVTEEGVQFIGWVYPKETIMTASENVQLLPFSEIQKSLKKLLEYGTGGFEGSPIVISRMVLTTSIAQIPNQGDEAFYVPTWVIFLTTEEEASLNFDIDVLLMNAIDGTFIMR